MPSTPPHGQALRKGRISETGRAYLLTTVIEHRRPVFADWRIGLMRRVKSRSAIAVNAALGTSGRLWQKGYHDHAVRAEEDLLAMARYVIANPLRMRLVAKLGDYPLWDAIWL